jgi:transposase
MKPEDFPAEIQAEIVNAHQKGYGMRKISGQLNVSRKNIRAILVQQGCLPAQRLAPQSRLTPFYQVIAQKVEKDLTTSRIFREIKTLGYQGKRTILAEHVRKLRSQIKPPSATKKVKRRFETRPAQEMQIDWSPYWVSLAGMRVLVHAFGCLLCCCRKLFLHFFRSERQSVLFEGMAMAFDYFEGCAHRVVSDNMSTAVLGRYAANGKPIWNDRYLQFARHYGFKAFACKVRDPDRKGKKEKSFRLVWDDFLKESSFESLEDLNHRARIWLDYTPEAGNLRVHGTTGRVPNEAWPAEKDLLIRLPEERFAVFDPEPRIVDQDATLSVGSKRYTVPSHLANRTVPLRLFSEHFEVLDRYGQLAFSRRYAAREDKRKLIIDKTHYAQLPRRPRSGEERLDRAFLKRFPSLALFVTGLQRKLKSIAPIHLRALLRLADAYGQDAFLDVATRVQQARRFDAMAVRRLLEHDYGPLPEQSPLPLGGSGADIVGDFEQDGLESFGHLDTQQPNTPTTTNERRDNNG